jgi:hypothetical protein
MRRMTSFQAHLMLALLSLTVSFLQYMVEAGLLGPLQCKSDAVVQSLSRRRTRFGTECSGK